MNANQVAQQSASAGVAAARSKRRSQKQQVTKSVHLDDRASNRARATLANTFQRTTNTLAPAPGVDTTSFPQENFMLVHMRENNSRTERGISFMTSHGGDATADSLFMDMLESGRFDDTLQQWHRRRGLTVQPIGSTDTTTNPAAAARPAGIVGIAAAARGRVVDVTGQSTATSAEDTDEPFDGEDSGDDAMPTLPTAGISYDNCEDIFDFAGFGEE